MASTYLTKTYSGSGNRQRQTMSMWIKRSTLGTNTVLFSVHYTGTYFGYLRFKTDDTLQYYINSPNLNVRTNAKFRDTNAWYHIVCTVDTTDATSDDRIKLYVNGERQTLQTNTQPSQNAEVTFGDNYRHDVGGYQAGSYFGGSMSHFHFVTNTAYQASSFGSTDSVTGEWQINTSPSVTYNTNSFFILKDGNSGTDQSGQSNNYSVGGGTLTKTEDNPSNVFNTFNLLDNYYESGEFTNGNTTYKTGAGSSVYARNTSTLGMTKGKFYWEVKPVAVNTSGDYYPVIGISSTQVTSATDWLGKTANDYGLQTSANLSTVQKMNNNAGTAWGSPFSLNDIVGVAVDLDNRKIYFSKNGTWMESGNPASGSTGTGSAFTITAPADTPLGAYFPSVSNYDGTGWVRFETNFGNGYFGTTAVSSAGTNASGIGIFEYDVPTGYTALSTKGLNL